MKSAPSIPERVQYRMVLCGHKAVEAAAVCMVLMVQGNLMALTLTHLSIASKTGLLAVFPAIGLTFTRYAKHFANRWTSSIFFGVCTFLADSFIHPSHYPGAYTEAALTGLGACAFSIAVSYTPLGKRIDALAESFLFSHEADSEPATEVDPEPEIQGQQ
jgi:hypothetical protein